MTALIDFKWEGFEAVAAMLGRLDPLPEDELLTGAARMIQEQTRYRIDVEKTDPQGAAWKPNRQKSPTLHDTGALSRSIQTDVGGGKAVIGSGLKYARIHQEGGVIKAKNKKTLHFVVGNRHFTPKSVTIPKRSYLGLSDQNRSDLLEQVTAFVKGRIKA